MHPKYYQVIKLRKEGKSYREITKITGVSKSSISAWCKNLKLSLKIQKILEAKFRHSKEKLAEYNRLKSERVKRENQEIKEKAAKEIRSFSKYELKLIGSALYWGEGFKSERTKTRHIQLSNSDPDLIKLFLRFLREVVKVPETKFKVSIRIHPNIDKEKAVDFWGKITNIPKDRFRITHQISKASKGIRPLNSLPYGTLDLRVNSRQKFYQIKGWIDGLIRQT